MSLDACADLVARGDPDRWQALMAAPVAALLVKRLKERWVLIGVGVLVLSITVDPARDTPEVLARSASDMAASAKWPAFGFLPRRGMLASR